MQREVYLKRSTAWTGRPSGPRSPARARAVQVEATCRNVHGGQRRPRHRHASAAAAQPRHARHPAGGTRRSRPDPDAQPQLWSPRGPYLYAVNLTRCAGGRKVGRYRCAPASARSSVRRRPLVLNGQRLNLRGVGVHEDSQQQGFAVGNAFRQRLVSEVKAVGATLMRTHYPMHPYTHELADREGVLIWSEVPVYALKTANLAKPGVTALAAKELEKNIIANQNHPSGCWCGRSPTSCPRGRARPQANYIRNAVRQAKALDPSRPVGIAVAGYPNVGCQKAYAPLDIIGINEYFGWYPGPSGLVFDRTKLPAYLDAVRACYPKQAVMVTEFGAEANRDGPGRGEGHVGLQQDFVNFPPRHLRDQDVAERRGLLGAERVQGAPGLGGRQPAAPMPPLHQKGVLRYGDFSRKPAWEDLHRNYAGTKQFG
jgi:beta-glucuronidase